MFTPDLTSIKLKLRPAADKMTVFDPIRKKWFILTPEEHVRQLMVAYLTGTLKYPPALIAVEKTIKVGAMSKRFDIVVYNRNHLPWMLVECKSPDVPISEKTLHQLLNYQRTMQCRYWLLTNGPQACCADAGDAGNIKWLDLIPPYDL